MRAAAPGSPSRAREQRSTIRMANPRIVICDGAVRVASDLEDSGGGRMKLKGKVALITGSGRGIGRGIAEVFAEEGADVVVNDIISSPETQETARIVCSKGRRSIFVQGDVSKRDDVEAMFAQAWEQLGAVD